MKEKKCQTCGKWTDGNNTHCQHCGALIDHKIIAEEKRQVRAEEKKTKSLENESKFAKYLRKLEESENPVHRFFFVILNAVFNIYMAILSFFIWLIAIASG